MARVTVISYGCVELSSAVTVTVMVFSPTASATTLPPVTSPVAVIATFAPVVSVAVAVTVVLLTVFSTLAV